MLKRRIPIINAVAFLLLVILPTVFYGSDEAVMVYSSSESKQNEDKIDTGLGLALEAINIAGDHTTVKGAKTKSFLNANVTRNRGFSEKNTDHDVEDKIAERPYKKTAEMHNPLITEPIKIQKQKHNNKIQSLIPEHFTIKVLANRPWTKTNIYLKENDIVKIHCKGKVMPGDFEYRYKNTSCLADGYHFTRGNFTVLPNARYMAAIAKIGNCDVFYVGSNKEFKSYVNGRLYLGLNELKKSVYTGAPINKRSIYWKDNTGYFEADIYVYRK